VAAHTGQLHQVTGVMRVKRELGTSAVGRPTTRAVTTMPTATAIHRLAGQVRMSFSTPLLHPNASAFTRADTPTT
jgi:hypothetical protein